MDSKKIIWIVVAVVLILVVGALLLTKRPPSSTSPGGGVGVSPAQPSGPTTRSAAPQNVVVPDKNTPVPSNVAQPQVVGPAAPNSTASFRSFSINISNNAYTPNTVIVKAGDTVHITFTAQDSNYDFTQPDYGFKVVIPKGQSKVVEFGATAAGKFTFFCTMCGGPASGPVGYIIVSP